jgi:hypothetical protein
MRAMTILDQELAPGAASPLVARARPQDALAIASALAAAFEDDPVFRWFSPDDERRAAMLPSFFDVFVDAYLAHGEISTAPGLTGAALWAPPRSTRSPPSRPTPRCSSG